jgi:hypothetical protein
LTGPKKSEFAVRFGRLGVYSSVAAQASLDNAGDGKLDLAVANSFSNTICVFLGNGDGTFRCAVHFPLLDSTDVQPLGLGVGDFNGDGRLDLAVSLRFLHRVAVLRNQVMAPVKK